MTGKSDFTEEEWNLVVEAPPTARIDSRDLVDGKDLYGGAEGARESELLDELVSAKPEMDHTRYK